MSKLLYVEDDPDIAVLARRWLEEEGHIVLHTDDGEEAINLASLERPDLVLLDINLGQFSIDGWETHRRLRAEPSTSGLPVVALSGHAQREEHIDRASREGFAGHIRKPFTYEELTGQVAAFLVAKGD
jgi:CheY-like chemotaxis protein